MDQNEPPTDSSQFEMVVQEDVAAELEAFILHYRLGHWNDADKILDIALWRHLNFFPVFAEAAVYLVERRDYGRGQRLINRIRAGNLVFVESEEQEFAELFTTLHTAASDLPIANRFLKSWIPSGVKDRSPVKVCFVGPFLTKMLA